jgi:hypothetical protein
MKMRKQRVGHPPLQVRMQLRMQVGAAPQRGMRTMAGRSVEPGRALHAVPAAMRRQPPADNAGAGAGEAVASHARGLQGVAGPGPSLRAPPTMTLPRATPEKRPPPMLTRAAGPRPLASLAARRSEGHGPAAAGAAAQPSMRWLHRSHRLQAMQPVASRPPAAVAAFAMRSPDLAWRAREPAPVAVPATVQAEPVHTHAMHAMHARQATAGSSVEPDDVQAVRTAFRNQPLDPAYVDRLVDDVIRRIDHRLRIERERRGL